VSLTTTIGAEDRARKSFEGKDHSDESSRLKMVSSARRANERTFELTNKIGGKILNSQEISASEDGKTLTIMVPAAARSEPNVLLFDPE
jgi:hypothetical protein